MFTQKIKNFYNITAKNTAASEKVTTQKDGDQVKFVIGPKSEGQLIIQYEDLENDCYVFSPYKEESFYKKICDHEFVISIQHLEVKPEARGKGYARKLMDQAIKYIKKTWASAPIYINASPMGPISLTDLVNFYKSYGFKVLKTYTAYNNASLWKDP